jgi:hypothetical protein
VWEGFYKRVGCRPPRAASVDLGAQPAFCCARWLGCRPLFTRSGTVLMRAHDGRIDHRVFIVRVRRQMLEQFLRPTAPSPTAEPRMHSAKVAKAFSRYRQESETSRSYYPPRPPSSAASSPFTSNYNLIHAGRGCEANQGFLKLCKLAYGRRLGLRLL